ncbi:MAG: glycosyltransferase family 2 protein [Brevefilum sp.]
MKIKIDMNKFFHPINIYTNLRKLYFAIIPKGSKAYDVTYGFLRIFLKRLHLLNIYYQEWVRRNDTLTEETIKKMKHQIQSMDHHPVISVLMPVYNPPLELLDQAIQSVISQIYPFWELCIADDASTDPRVLDLLREFAQQDQRIKIVLREENGHISAASNSALELVSSDFVALLDHDDLLHPLALFYVAQCILEHPKCNLIYSDEDKLTAKGRRLDPYFKPDFNYELFLSQNMISHLGVYRTEILRKIGGFRVGLEGSQDYDLALRVLDQSTPDQIQHIPRPLYHWRIIKSSAASDLNVKPYAVTSAQRALTDHLARQNIQAEVTFLPEVAAYGVSYTLADPPPSVSIVIPVETLSNPILKNIKSIIETTEYPDFDVVLGCPENSAHEFSEELAELSPRARIVTFADDSTYASRVNQTIHATTSDFVCLLDGTLTGYQPDWLKALMSQATQKGIGAVAPRLINQSRRVYSNGIILVPDKIFQHLSQGEEQDLNGYFGWSKLVRGYSAISEKCLLFRKSYFDDFGGFEEAFQLPIFCGADFCLKLRNGEYRNILIPSIELYIPGKTNRIDHLEKSNPAFQSDKQIFIERWCDWVDRDPVFNPNLFFTEVGKMLVNLTPDIKPHGE